MIDGNECDKIYFSDKLKYDNRFSSTFNEIEKILLERNISYELLTDTKDIWARDYMPIQVRENKYIEYRYDPDYLLDKVGRKLKTYPDIILEKIGLKTLKSNIILDGGNVVQAKSKAILTDKILIENKHQYNKTELLDKLKDLFEIDDIILIPWDKENEKYGHSDGMIRFVDENTILTHKFYKEYPKDFKTKFDVALSKLERLEFQFDVSRPNEKLNWAYINFLQTKDIILLPAFDIEEDEQAFKQMEKYFPNYADKNAIVPVKMNDIAKYDGALNCISWTVKV